MQHRAAVPLVAVMTFALLGIAPQPAPHFPHNSFLPENDMRISVDSLDAKGLTRQEYDAVMDRIQEVYGPVIAGMGGRLVVNRLWDDDTVNASATRQGSDYVINMYGGLARHESITQDGMALVACHELGHHIGGAPKYGGWNGWASNEGQSDYWANMKCLHRIFAGGGSASFTKAAMDETEAAEACAKSYAGDAQRRQCVRSAMAGMSVSRLFQALRRQPTAPRFSTPDPAVVQRTSDRHPDTQCRLDTYFSGSLCTQPHMTDVDQRDPIRGTCTASQGFKTGLRPRCWYKPGAAELVDEAVASAEPKRPVPTLVSTLSSRELWKGL